MRCKDARRKLRSSAQWGHAAIDEKLRTLGRNVPRFEQQALERTATALHIKLTREAEKAAQEAERNRTLWTKVPYERGDEYSTHALERTLELEYRTLV